MSSRSSEPVSLKPLAIPVGLILTSLGGSFATANLVTEDFDPNWGKGYAWAILFGLPGALLLGYVWVWSPAMVRIEQKLPKAEWGAAKRRLGLGLGAFLLLVGILPLTVAVHQRWPNLGIVELMWSVAMVGAWILWYWLLIVPNTPSEASEG